VFLIESTAAGVITSLGGSAGDFFSLNSLNHNLDAIAGTAYLDGGGGDAVHFYDQSNAAAETFTVSGTSVSRGVGVINLAQFGWVDINGSATAGTT
jgi:hypothetical protein